MNIGIDIVEINRIERIIVDKDAMRKLFHPAEMSDYIDNLAGILAVKEAYMKACGHKLDWLSVEVKKNDLGSPHIVNMPNVKISISHDGGYAVAIVIIND